MSASDIPVGPAQEGAGQVTGEPVSPTTASPTVAPTGRRESLRNVGRRLSDEEMRSPGAVKLITEQWENAEIECESLKPYVQLFYQADKAAAVLQERLTTAIKIGTKIEIGYGVGVGVGGLIAGLAPLFWSERGWILGWVCFIVGVVLVAGGIAIRAVKE